MIRVGTFNLNNLFDRFNFHAAIPEVARVDATYRWRLDANLDILLPVEDTPNLFDDQGRPIVEGIGPVKIELSPMGRLVKDKNPMHLLALLNRVDRMNADVLAVQEVENIIALKEFNSILDAPYPHLALLEGNDPRFIDIGVLSRYPIKSAISHRWVPDPNDPTRFLFSRDLLAVEIMDHQRKDVVFTVWVNHLKSKFIDPFLTDAEAIEAANAKNDNRRRAQAQEVENIIEKHHDLEKDLFIVCGDMNDDPSSSTLDPIVRGNLDLVDVFENGVEVDFERPENEGPRISNPEDQPESEDWTHRLSRSHAPDIYERFDQIFVSKALCDKIDKARIQRRTHWGKHHAGGDHDPVWVDLNI